MATKNNDEKFTKFLDTMIWYFSEKTTPTGFYHTVGKIEKRLGEIIKLGDEFNKTIKKANESSDNLTRALNRITLAGVIIAGLGLLVAISNLIFEVYKYTH